MRRSVNDNFDDDDNLEAYDGDDQEHNDRDYWRGMSPPPRYSTPDATPRQPTSTPPALDRYMRQPPSTRGKVVYVLFGGSQPGVWYNWTALVYHREHAYPPGQQPTNRGYRSYWAAHAAYGEFCRTGLVPASEESGWTPPPEPPNWNPPPPPHEASRPPSTPSRLTRPAGSAPPISPSTPRVEETSARPLRR
ncbi:hypothetical protein NLJ89_g8747 [Agrocybe chaxingu]|uniref:Uncharacterized protein n=1 Tax=Agrocybe chaxingu TaxID=84603 RepID=A0A9W8JUM4_9AGAR|nr:hypothetical protein NLJ89_g8747 [Agrocybe chaxingu]